jgi:hypothetical protein
MNWKIVFQLSIFGLIMAIATISLIPENAEVFFWIAIFIFCAYVIAKTCQSKYFLNGFFVSLVNCIWITAAHLIFYSTYVTNHPSAAKMGQSMPMQNHPRLLMLLMGPLFGIVFGLILGLLSWIASKIVKPKQPAI